MTGYPKGVKRHLTELSMEAHERELAREFEKLADKFDQWRRGEISAGELGFIVHDFASGPLRDLFKFYNRAPVHMRVGCAVAEGILRREEISEQVWPHIEGAVEGW